MSRKSTRPVGPVSKSDSSEHSSFFAELKRRKVFRVAFTYAIVGWLVIQIVATTFPSLVIPDWAMRLVIMCVLLGFPIALVITWAFEITPEGIKRTSTARREGHWKRFTDSHNRKRNLIAFGFGAAVPTLIFGALFLFIVVGTPRGRAGRTFEKSIAVLPFENRSRLEEDRYFADGIHDDLLSQISRIGGIRTISRTSVMVYRNSPKNLRTIRDELGVATILEGSVQRSGRIVRISVQLIDAALDVPLWSGVYARDLTAENIFRIQSEIAATIADKLEAVLTPEDQSQLDRLPTRNLDALEAYFQGKASANTDTSEGYEEAIEHFKRAIQLDPGFAEAYAGQASALLVQIFFSGLPAEKQTAKAAPLIARAIELDRRSSWAYLALGVLNRYENNPAAAETAFQRSIELNPNNEKAYLFYGHLQNWVLMNPEAAVSLFKKAIELSPQTPGPRQQLAEALMNSGRLEEAKSVLTEVIATDPEFAEAYRTLGLLQNRYLYHHDAAIKAYRAAFAMDPGNPTLAAYLGDSYFDIGLKDAAIFWYERACALAPDGQSAVSSCARIHEIRGEEEQMRSELQKLHAGQDLFIKAVVELGSHDVQSGNPDSALARYEEAFPELTMTDSKVDSANMGPAIAYASTLLAAGKPELAEPWVRGVLAILPSVPRFGRGPIEIWDAWLYLSLGDKTKALAALRDWRGAGGTRSLSDERFLEPLFNDPEFKKLQDEINADLALQRKRLARMEANGELAPIPDLPSKA